MSVHPATRTSPRFSPRPVAVLAVALLIAAGSHAVALVGGVAVGGPGAAAPVPAEVPLPGAVGEAQPLERIDRAIATWTGNLERDAADFIAATNLAELYLARARITGLSTDYGRSLSAVEQALDTDPSLVAARALNAQILFASHDFEGAEAAASALLVDHPGLPQALATLGDARLERGDYDGAAAAYGELADAFESPAITARQARLASVTGSLDDARRLAAAATAAAVADGALPAADRAWYHVLEGALAFQAGDLVAAERAYRQALDAWSGSAPAWAGLGRVLAGGGSVDEAIAAYERAVAIVPQPDSLAALGDLLAASGRHAEAETRYAQVRAIGAIEAEAGLHNRSLVLFLANHGEAPARAVEMAAAELAGRTDVYGWDAYAWALYAAGRFDDADAAMTMARVHGTQDAQLDFHAGMIAAALGRTEDATRQLRAALDRNPGFDILQAARARETLAQLEAGQ
ncbi:MAG TPA: tetratricopeptide repeat protein [candidate division Zixibacteria bacterium]|nr:tetratricopeptide repeat protein [candidate division Zixibacteria bacterium]